MVSASPNPSGTGPVSPDPEGTGAVSPDPEGTGAVSLDPEGTGFVSPDPSGMGSVSLNPSDAGSASPAGSVLPPTNTGPSVWAWVKPLTPEEVRARLDVTHGHTRGFASPTVTGAWALCCLIPVWPMTSTSVHHVIC